MPLVVDIALSVPVTLKREDSDLAKLAVNFMDDEVMGDSLTLVESDSLNRAVPVVVTQVDPKTESDPM